MHFLFISDEIAYYEEMLILGDNFTSRTYRDGVQLSDDLFITKYFDVKRFCNNRWASANTNILSRIENKYARALKENDKLPNYVVVVLDDDLIEDLMYQSEGVAEMYGERLEYSNIIIVRNDR